MKKIFLLFLSLLFLNSLAFAGEIDEYIAKSGIEQKSTVAIYALDSRNKALFKKNHHKLLIPASTLKLLTFGASYLTLKENYKFETAVYRDCDNNFYIKLGADPLLTSGDLLKLFNQIADTKPNNVYIDDTIIDKTPYPEGWMEEDVWPYARAITPYIIDENMFEVLIKRSAFETKVEILQDTPYQPSIINELVLGDKQDYKIQKLYGEDSSIIGLEGTINKDELVKIPVINPQINFQIHVINAMKKAGIKNPKKIQFKKTPGCAKKIAVVYHTIEEISKNILHNSDNFSAEVVFKVAAAKYIKYSHPATLQDAISMLENTFPFEEGIKITDGSGVSRNNFLSANYLVRCIQKLFSDQKFKSLLATSNEGTLSDRLIFLEGNLRAKTGTMANMSSIAGGLTTKKGRDVAFAIIIQNSPKRKAILKNFENNIIGLLYRKY